MKAILKLVVAVWMLGAGFQGTAMAAAHATAASAGGVGVEMISDWDCSRFCD